MIVLPSSFCGADTMTGSNSEVLVTLEDIKAAAERIQDLVMS